MTARDVAVVISTYERPEALDAVLRALCAQSEQGFEVVVADDGSGNDIAAVVHRWKPRFTGPLDHVWQPDEGYRAARIFDLAFLATRSSYVAFVPADAVPRRHFVRALRRAMEPGWFLAGRRLLLSQSLTARVIDDRVPIHEWSAARWFLQRRHVDGLAALTTRDRRDIGVSGLPDFEPAGRAYVLTGVWRSDFESVNGYDTRFVGWGDEDVDLATRLRHLGLRCGHGGPQATLLHLWHESREVVGRPNWALLRETEATGRSRAVVGLDELAREVSLN